MQHAAQQRHQQGASLHAAAQTSEHLRHPPGQAPLREDADPPSAAAGHRHPPPPPPHPLLEHVLLEPSQQLLYLLLSCWHQLQSTLRRCGGGGCAGCCWEGWTQTTQTWCAAASASPQCKLLLPAAWGVGALPPPAAAATAAAATAQTRQLKRQSGRQLGCCCWVAAGAWLLLPGGPQLCRAGSTAWPPRLGAWPSPARGQRRSGGRPQQLPGSCRCSREGRGLPQRRRN